MKALVFGVEHPEPPPEPVGPDAPRLMQHLAVTPMAIEELPDPKPIGPDWVVLRTRLTGVCGSDTKQVVMDFEGGDDNPMTAFISFPQVLGHEVVAEVVELGPEAQGLELGQRVVLNPWLSCGPRGIDPMCEPCRIGDFNMCEHFNDGRLSPGIHTGNAVEATGGYADLLPAHDSMCIPVPDGLTDEQAVLGDPFSVSLHGIVRTPPPPGGKVVVYGAGALGTTAVAALRALYPDVAVACVAMWPAQAALVERLGAKVFSPEPRDELVEALVDWSGGVLHRPWAGLPVAHPGRIDVVYDTIGGAETLEVGVRVLASRGAVVQLGVNSPKRFEWTPIYFKELRWVGSNAFGVEEVEGRRQHAIAHYLEMAATGRIDLTGMLTHTFRLPEWRTAFTTLLNQGETGAIKVAFDFR